MCPHSLVQRAWLRRQKQNCAVGSQRRVTPTELSAPDSGAEQGKTCNAENEHTGTLRGAFQKVTQLLHFLKIKSTATILTVWAEVSDRHTNSPRAAACLLQWGRTGSSCCCLDRPLHAFTESCRTAIKPC